MSIFQAIIIAIVEGITEFLPISSTGHMIITQQLLGIGDDAFVKAFIVNIQFGAILSVVVLYWKRFFQSLDFYFKLIFAFIPSAVLGLLLNDVIDELLESPTTVAVSLLLGGVVLVFIDKVLNPKTEIVLTFPKAFVVGLTQCISMIPGVSRSAATIIGGMSQGLTRKQAAEFSFFLAVPTMFGASALKLIKALDGTPEIFTTHNLTVLAIGNLVAFLVAMLAIRFFVSYLTQYGFRVFGWYRIILGALLLILLGAGVNLSVL
ncbi:MAG: undecaprenyl-diphosphate phosphatase [Flavobacteriales bacterium]